MRGLFLLVGLVAAAAANKLGYDYQAPGQNVAIGTVGGTGTGEFDENTNSDSNRIDGNNSNNINNSGEHNAIHGLSSGLTGHTESKTNALGYNRNLVNDLVPAPEYNKEYFSYTAPEEEFTDHEATQRVANTLKKNLRVVFIKSPENQGLTNAALQLAKQASEERTAIYVLSKQTDLSDLVHRLQSVNSQQSHKPDVHFVKYRTQEEAQRAQQFIQAQYDQLGGTSHSSNEGVAPVLNFVSEPSIGGIDLRSSSANDDNNVNERATIPKSTYLPAAFRLKK